MDRHRLYRKGRHRTHRAQPHPYEKELLRCVKLFWATLMESLGSGLEERPGKVTLCRRFYRRGQGDEICGTGDSVLLITEKGVKGVQIVQVGPEESQN